MFILCNRFFKVIKCNVHECFMFLSSEIYVLEILFVGSKKRRRRSSSSACNLFYKTPNVRIIRQQMKYQIRKSSQVKSSQRLHMHINGSSSQHHDKHTITSIIPMDILRKRCLTTNHCFLNITTEDYKT